MIVTRLNGGLGNQLFQYAFGRCLAERHGVPLYLDIRDYRHSPQHGLLINHFAIDAQFLDKELFSVVPDILRRSRWQRLMWNMNPAHVRWVREKPFGFQPRWISLGKSVYLDGYWQSALFFDDIADMIRKQFKLITQPSLATHDTAARMRRTRSVAIHIRRGDYTTNASIAKIYRTLPLSYYEHCLRLWSPVPKGTAVFIFSNDIGWCKENIHWAYPSYFVDHTDASTAYEDLYLMQQADACIIANSTLSWWGAWLGRSSGQVVFTPDDWFYPNTLNGQYLPCADWVRVPAADSYS